MKILLVDTSNIVFRSFGRSQYVFGSIIDRCVRAYPDYILVFGFDGRNSKARRQEVYSGYKASRAETHDQNREELDRIWEQANYYIEHFRPQAPHLKLDGWEFDDLAYSLTSLPEVEAVALISNDRDMWQLLNLFPGKVVIDRHSHKDLLEYFSAHLDSKPHYWWIWIFKVLFGDPSDEVTPALPRVKKALVANWLKQYPETAWGPGYEKAEQQLLSRLAEGLANGLFPGQVTKETVAEALKPDGLIQRNVKLISLLWCDQLDWSAFLATVKPESKIDPEEVLYGEEGGLWGS